MSLLIKPQGGAKGCKCQTLHIVALNMNRVTLPTFPLSLTTHILGGASSKAFLSLINEKVSGHYSVTPLQPWKESLQMRNESKAWISVNSNKCLYHIISYMAKTGDNTCTRKLAYLYAQMDQLESTEEAKDLCISQTLIFQSQRQ